ncbi:hypothetical protein H5410_048960 [Solanum commersonii]|uniref:Uncharacterized protein n=1 Tax=Solanum commersonii TaxID=4109 RepID=A0A9J5XNB5_SOLCO|nr:hypothetical protein H5410_048960 [Solanum commersonii]
MKLDVHLKHRQCIMEKNNNQKHHLFFTHLEVKDKLTLLNYYEYFYEFKKTLEKNYERVISSLSSAVEDILKPKLRLNIYIESPYLC